MVSFLFISIFTIKNVVFVDWFLLSCYLKLFLKWIGIFKNNIFLIGFDESCLCFFLLKKTGILSKLFNVFIYSYIE